MHDIAERPHGSGHDRNLLNGFGILLQCADQRVTDLMVGNDLAFLLAHDAVLLLFSDQNDFHGAEEILLADIFPALLDRVDGSLVDHIGQVGAYRAAGCESDRIQIHGLVHLDILRMHLQNLHTALEVRLIHDDSSVKTTGAKQRLIQNLGAVGRAQNQDALGAVKTVHLGEQLVQGLFSLLVASAVLGITASSDGIDLIDKDDTGSVLGRFLEQIAHTAGTHADIKLNKIGTGQ